MTEFKIGDLLKHSLSGSLYYYVGDHPTRNIVVISTPDGVHSYSIGDNELSQYYDLAPPERQHLEKYCKYKNTATLAHYEIRDTFVYPDSDKRVTFAWCRRSETGNYFPRLIEEMHYDNYVKI